MIKKNSQRKNIKILIQTVHSNDITLQVGKQGVYSAEGRTQAPVFRKSATETKIKLTLKNLNHS